RRRLLRFARFAIATLFAIGHVLNSLILTGWLQDFGQRRGINTRARRSCQPRRMVRLGPWAFRASERQPNAQLKWTGMYAVEGVGMRQLRIRAGAHKLSVAARLETDGAINSI